jgi:hypothetical protein
MNTFPLYFAEPFPINQLPETNTLEPGSMFLQKDNGEAVMIRTEVISKIATSAVKGEATPTSFPTPYVPADYPDGLYEKWEVKTPGTYINFINSSNVPIEISADDLEEKLFYINVTNGVSKKDPIDLPKASNYIKKFSDLTFPAPAGTQAIHEDGYYFVDQGQTATVNDVPGVSSKWVRIGTPISKTFNPSTKDEAQGGKQISDYLFGTLESYSNILMDTAIGDSWENVPVSGFDSLKIPVQSQDLIKIVGLTSSNTQVNVCFRKNGLKYYCDYPIINTQFAIPAGFSELGLTINGEPGWFVERNINGAIDQKAAKITESSIFPFWESGSLDGNGNPAPAPGYFRSLILTQGIEYLKFENLTGASLKLYRDDKQFVLLENIAQNTEYSTKGYSYFLVVRSGSPTGDEIITAGKKSAAKLYTPYLDLIDFGLIPGKDVDDATRDFNTQKANEAAIQVLENGGGTLFGRTEKFRISKITIPVSNFWRKIEIAGAVAPVHMYGTVGAYDINSVELNQMELISDLQDPTSGVINVSPGNLEEGFNYVELCVTKLRIKTYQNPNCHGINASNAIQLKVEDVGIDTGVYNVLCLAPTHGTTGIITPKNNNAALTYLTNPSVQGFYSGYDINEHTDGQRVNAHSCKNGLILKNANHASYFARVLMQRCTNYITVEGHHIINIAQLNMEQVGTGQYDSTNAWQKALYQVNDPNNLGIGSITWANVRGNVAGSSPYISIKGAAGLIIKREGSENRLLDPGSPDPNPA